MKRVFVRGMSRSGGTLMATVLDAHRDIAMCYEVYEHLLAPPENVDGESDAVQRDIELIRDAMGGFALTKNRKLKKIEDGNLQKFVFRAMRAGIEPETLVELMKEHQARGGDFQTFDARMNFIERIGLAKAKREGKNNWGTKIGGICEQLHALWPDSYFLFMLRDGRDVAASRRSVGEFAQGVEHIAGAWRDQIRNFRKFADRPGVNAHIVHYETLTTDPRSELERITTFLGLPWDDRLMSFHDQDLTIYKNPTGHLSRDQVSRPINTTSVGRWKRDLSAEEVAVFEAKAGDLLAELGYEPATTAAKS